MSRAFEAEGDRKTPEPAPGASRLRYDQFRVTLRKSRKDREDADGKDDGNPPLSKAEKRAKRWVNLRRYREVIWPFRWAVAGMFGLALVAAVMDAAVPYAFGHVIDHVLDDPATPTEQRRTLLLAICGGIFVLLVSARLVDAFRFYHTMALNSKMVVHLRVQLHRRLLGLGLGDIQNLKTGKIVSRLAGDVDQAMSLLQQGVMSPGVALARVVLTLGILFGMNWRLAIAALMILPPVVVLSLMWVVKVRPIFKSAGHDRNETDARVTETFAGIRVVRAFRREVRELRDATVGNHTMIRKRLLAHRRAMVVDIFWELVIPLVTLAILLIGGLLYLARPGVTSVGEIVAFNMYAGMLMWPIARIVFSLNQTQQSLAAVERVFEIYDLPMDKVDAPDAVAAPAEVEQLRFDAVDFAYQPDKPVIRDFSLVVPGGSVVALVGPSGAGKSTLCDLVARFHDPTAGAILLNGIDLRQIRLASYRQKLAIVQQDTFLFDGTVRENIAYGRRGASDGDIELAARRANAHSFITELEKGYQTIIGERGVKLSGGQRQRLSIARALLADPQILILDEATSNLDSESEQLIQAALQELYENRTTFVIAHRLSTVTHADLIVVIDQGRLVEVGTHAALLARGGMYADMVARQSDAFGDPLDVVKA